MQASKEIPLRPAKGRRKRKQSKTFGLAFKIPVHVHSQEESKGKITKKKMTAVAVISDFSEEEETQELRLLLEKFMRKSEELQKRESNLLKQVEFVQSAVTSLLAWKQSTEPVASATDTPHVDVREIEKETNQIRAETERIRREVEKKAEENRKLEEEIERRKTQRGGVSEFVPESSSQELEQGGRLRTGGIESRQVKASDSSGLAYDPGIEFFNEKLRKLEGKKVRLRSELQLESEEAWKKKKMLKEKIDRLERGSKIDRGLISSIKGKTATKK